LKEENQAAARERDNSKKRPLVGEDREVSFPTQNTIFSRKKSLLRNLKGFADRGWGGGGKRALMWFCRKSAKTPSSAEGRGEKGTGKRETKEEKKRGAGAM